MRARTPDFTDPSPRARPRSTTGTTDPRRSITPSISVGAFGSGVTACQRTTSRIWETSIAYTCPPTSKQPRVTWFSV